METKLRLYGHVTQRPKEALVWRGAQNMFKDLESGEKDLLMISPSAHANIFVLGQLEVEDISSYYCNVEKLKMC